MQFVLSVFLCSYVLLAASAFSTGLTQTLSLYFSVHLAQDNAQKGKVREKERGGEGPRETDNKIPKLIAI